ncbi:HDL297Wp [Eremothecium sinecaudum]|uniref:HDL297Wp n=1 Tax=Eremothecium sinecaudum TaxID=45286 RepID=A0A109UYW4_9SACH|nr:HDL297Wp [Eremothecium sinecaudum]AMD20447.1 HDL297Wp [Eremothecium sinecaudum]
MDKRPYKRALKQFDVNVQRKRSLRNKKDLMNDTSPLTSFYENDEKNKENKNPLEKNKIYTKIFGDSPTSDGNLTDELNTCLNVNHNDHGKSSKKLTKESLMELQLLLREFEVQQFSGCDHKFCQDGLSVDNLCQCRTNFLFELECFENRDMITEGNLRVQCYCKNVYNALDRNWLVSASKDVTEQDQWEGLEWLLLPKEIMRQPKKEKSVADVSSSDMEPKKTGILPATVLQIRSTNRAFEDSVDLSEIFKQWTSSSSSSSLSNLDLPNDSFEHCPSAKAKCALKKRILRPSDIVFPH